MSRHAAFILAFVIFAVVLAGQIDHGLASSDGHGIVKTVQTLLNTGKIDVSRPPGHPTTEVYLFGAVGWFLLNAFQIEFSDRAYLVCQALAALATLVIFYELLLRIGVNRPRAVLATICLACSAQFLFNALDGEEFNFGLLFLLVSVRLLIPAPASVFRFSLSIFCFALATGCRPELVFGAIIFPIYCLFDPKLGWKWVVGSICLLVVSILIVWLPNLLVGIRVPYTAGMNLRESILGGVYRIIFQAFTPAVSILFGWTLIAAVPSLRKEIEAKNFVFVTSFAASLIFLAVFSASIQGRARLGRGAVSLDSRDSKVVCLDPGHRLFQFAQLLRQHRHLQRSATDAAICDARCLFPSDRAKAVLQSRLSSKAFDPV